jgi:hypothetical protein
MPPAGPWWRARDGDLRVAGDVATLDAAELAGVDWGVRAGAARVTRPSFQAGLVRIDPAS